MPVTELGSAEVPELPGCLTEAYSLDELKRNLPAAVECWLGGAEDLRRAEYAEVDCASVWA